jgi:pyrroline-5-carboxylate reductase
MKDCKIAFLGGGNMALSLIGGLVSDGFNPSHIHIADPDANRLETIKASYAVQTYTDNTRAINECRVIVPAVKPQQLQHVVKQCSPLWQDNMMLISIAAGIRLNDIARWLERPNAAIVRTMPNTPALVQAGATALYANEFVSAQQKELAESILRAVGITLWVQDEEQINVVTALSGSGPAYFFLVMEAIETAAIELGLEPETAKLLCLQTAFGASKMALESNDSTALLRQKVTSPGGTTERAIHELEDGGLRSLFENALIAAALRARELATQLGEDHV